MMDTTENLRAGGDVNNTAQNPVSGAVKPKKQYVKNASAVVAAWRKDNPLGHKAELFKTGLLSHSSINRYWDSCGEGDRPLSASEKIVLWRYDNPLGTKQQCQQETGLSRRSVYLHWNDKTPVKNKPGGRKKKEILEEKTEEEKDVKISVDKNGQQFFDF